MWWLKVVVQFLLSWIPGGERINYRLQLAAGSHSPERARERVLEQLGPLKAIRTHLEIDGATAVEVGTGWDAIGAIVLRAAGAKVIHTFDHVRHARLALIQTLLAQMRLEAAEIAAAARVPTVTVQERIAEMAASETLEELFDRGHIRYAAPGDGTRTGLPNRSVDLYYTFAVMEHVPESVITALNAESQRILRPGGLAYRLIGLGDHYRTRHGFVNFLRYPEWLWRTLVKNKFSYHNRLRGIQVLDLLKSNGAHLLDVKTDVRQADVDFLTSMVVHRRFAGMTPEELAAYRLQVLLRFD